MSDSGGAPYLRLGFYVPQPDGTVDIAVGTQNLPIDVFEELERKTAVLFEIQPIAIAIRIVELNHAELVTLVQGQDERGQMDLLRTAFLLERLSTVAQRIGNFLASASAFLDSTKRRLEYSHGAAATACVDWNDKRQALHVSHFSYRFLYQLRHYAQHASLPLSSLQVTGTAVTADRTLRLTHAALLSRDALLAEGFDWKKVRPELALLPPEIDIMPLAADYLTCLRALALDAIRAYDERLTECDMYLRALLRGTRMPANAIPVFFTRTPPPPGAPPTNVAVILDLTRFSGHITGSAMFRAEVSDEEDATQRWQAGAAVFQ